MTETQFAGTVVSEAVPVGGTTPEGTVLGQATTEAQVPVAPEPTKDVVRSPEIQDAEPIRSAPMSEAAPTSRGGLELLSDDLIDPAAVA
jgi:hypothetical protein